MYVYVAICYNQIHSRTTFSLKNMYNYYITDQYSAHIPTKKVSIKNVIVFHFHLHLNWMFNGRTNANSAGMMRAT